MLRKSQRAKEHSEERRQKMEENLAGWVADLGVIAHDSGGEVQLDVFPVFRTWEVSQAQ